MKIKLSLILLFFTSLGIAQVNPIDSSFGTNGVVFTPLDTGRVISEASLIQTDGKIVIAGMTPISEIYTSRYLADGLPDNTFGINGTASIPFINLRFISSIIQLTGGELLLGGSMIDTSAINSFIPILVKLKSSGVLDNTFGNNGISIIPTDSTRITVLEELSNGKILAYGSRVHTDMNSYYPQAFMARLHANGNLDTSFHTNIATPWGITGISSVVEVSSTDRIVLGSSDLNVYDSGGAGPGRTYDNTGISMTKIDINGTIDTSFGSFIDFYSSFKPTNVAIQGQNHILTIGYESDAPGWNNYNIELYDYFNINRYDVNGNIDSTFGINGKVRTDLGGESMATGIYVMPNNDFIVTGISTPNGSPYSQFTIVKYTSDGLIDSSCAYGIHKGIAAAGTSYPYHIERTPNLLIQDDNGIILTGAIDTGSTKGFVMARYFMRPVDTRVDITGNMQLTAKAENSKYQWIDCITGNPIPGDTNKVFNAQKSGFYAVVVYQNDCSDTSVCYSLFVGGIEDLDRSTISIFPNPNNGSFTVELHNSTKPSATRFTNSIENQQIMSITRLHLLNLQGQIIYRSESESGSEERIEIQLDTEPGIYFLQVSSEAGMVTKKIVIQ